MELLSIFRCCWILLVDILCEKVVAAWEALLGCAPSSAFPKPLRELHSVPSKDIGFFFFFKDCIGLGWLNGNQPTNFAHLA